VGFAGYDLMGDVAGEERGAGVGVEGDQDFGLCCAEGVDQAGCGGGVVGYLGERVGERLKSLLRTVAVSGCYERLL